MQNPQSLQCTVRGGRQILQVLDSTDWQLEMHATIAVCATCHRVLFTYRITEACASKIRWGYET
eukprot:m.694078 g.694078  ORF g.694078 m.694078 type:complete len:64 (-) comp22877_c0_seq4:117-308(-)